MPAAPTDPVRADVGARRRADTQARQARGAALLAASASCRRSSSVTGAANRVAPAMILPSPIAVAATSAQLLR